ncbi:hypothetical protein FSP39_002695 [Pinctada imbricata]|uniref:Protein unc-80 homolog n=1 Tax=Pinctada imbricata TaxID=66713 RepID=A0AA89BMS9_PINIB|nr:hypothetical protein FSP39_002695 [Pinctada imbricata]
MVMRGGTGCQPCCTKVCLPMIKFLMVKVPMTANKETGLSRSRTDSDISYHHEEEVHEVSGSLHYIQNNGHLNYKVILQAVHFISVNQATERICEVLLNIMNCLLDLDIFERRRETEGTATPAPTPETPDSQGKRESVSEQPQTADTSDSSKEITAHTLAMDSLFSIFKALGCPHGCGDGVRSQLGDHLRSKGHTCLQRLQHINPVLFRIYLKDTVKRCPIQETVDFLHAFLGFCVDPSYTLQQERKRSGSGSQENAQENGFHNNFGHSIGGVGYRGVEGVLIANILKPFISRSVENTRDLYGSDNISLFCDIRQFMAYCKEIHGGTFRRVELSGLLDSVLKLKRQEKAKEVHKETAKPIRRTISQTSESGDDTLKAATPSSAEDVAGQPKQKKSIFKKKLKKSLTLQPYAAASDSEILDDMRQTKANGSTVTDDDSVSSSGTARRRFSKFHLGWRRGAKSDHEDEGLSDPSPLDRRESKSEMQVPRAAGFRGKMSFKTASHATITFLSARKRIEGGLKSLGKRMSKRGSVDDWKQKDTTTSDDMESEASTIVKEKKLVDKYLIKSGMLRFSFLLECCHPGSIPDPQLVAAMLELEAPVVARAALLLECAHFIHRCNHGDWPNWMRLNLPSFRQSAAALQNRGQPSGYRRTLTLQKAAGRMFYKWAENLGSMMEYILAKEHKDRLNILSDIRNEAKKRELRVSDEEEDFLDEASVNESGMDCPYALKMVACLVLQEITTFLRETFRDFHKGRSTRRDTAWDRSMANRRWSSIISSPGHSHSSESNMAEIPHSSSANVVVGSPGGAERKISFAVLGDRSDSVHSSTTSISGLDPSVSPNIHSDEKRVGRRLAQGRQKLFKHFRRGSGHNSSFRQNRSFRQHKSSFKRFDSFKSRKVSSQSLQSEKDKQAPEDEGVHTEDNQSIHSDEDHEASVSEPEGPDDSQLSVNMPWIRVVVQLANLSNFICCHQNYCHPNCYERQRRSCSRLVNSLKQVYQSTENDEDDKKADTRRDTLRERLKRRESIFQQSSPTRRRESTPLLEKIKSDVSMSKLKLSSSWKKEEKPKEVKEESVMIKYLTSQAQKLTQCPMGIVAKAAPILSEDNLTDILPVAWELILETDQELAAAAASVFLIVSVKAPEKAQKLIAKELQHEDTTQRINAVLRFGILWKFRHQVWPRMEVDANLFFKIPPPNIDFTLPSPTIGMPVQTVVDPPWMPHFKAKIEEVTVNQEESKSLVTTTTTRRKQQQEMIRKAFQAEEERKRVGREKFPMTSVHITYQAANELALHHAGEEHEEATMSEELSNLAARRVSLAPINRANVQSRSLSWRNGSLHWARIGLEGDEERTEHLHHMQPAPTFFPSCICSTVLPIMHLIEDSDVSGDGVSVSEVAEKVIWNCIVEDPALFLRYFLEKLTHRDKQEELFFLLRKLILHYRELPAQMARTLFNYLIGYIMFYVRAPCSGSQEAIAGALGLLWQVIPSVEGIYFNVLKQVLKKEQCDPYILISANVPSAKKILINGPDEASIPSQLPIHEDTQFSHLLQESLDFFNIPEEDYSSYFIVDTKSNQIHNLNSYVRDFYFFRRNHYPQLSLVALNTEEALLALERQAFTLKFLEIGKVLFTTKVLSSTTSHQMQTHVSFLHEEFLKLPSFPRKALESEFSLYTAKGGEELYGLDTLHKCSWVKLIETLFNSMQSTFGWTNDLLLFLNVVNGCIVLHCEDTGLLRYCLAVLINTSRHFKHVFSMNGFMHIMPTLLKVYSNNQPNPVICQALEFVCCQFYILHRKPFILQMFGSVTPILDMNFEETGLIDSSKVQPDCLFKLLLTLGKDAPADSLSIMDLVEGDKPLTAMDFCYESDPEKLDILHVINMCVTVIAYAPDSFRGNQMLTILEVVVQRFLEHIRNETVRVDKTHAARTEVSSITSLGISMRALIFSCENFTRSMNLPRQFEDKPNVKSVASNHSPLGGTSYYDDREDSHVSRHDDGKKKQHNQETEELEMANEYRRPRDALLNVVAEFYSTCQPRLKSPDLRRMMADTGFRPPELLDARSHNRLAEIAHTLLKLAPYDPVTLCCTGLQRYMTEILPLTDWKQEAVRPGLNLILRRLDRFFNKISKKSSLRRQADWDAAANLLKGLFLMLRKYPDIGQFHHMKVPGAPVLPEMTAGIHGSHRSDPATVYQITPPAFCSAVVKVVAMQMQALGDQYSLEQVCGGSCIFPSHEKCINMLINFILPLCIRLGCGRRDVPRLRTHNVNFALSVILQVLCPPVRAPPQGQQNSTSKPPSHHTPFNSSMSENHQRCGSISQSDRSRGTENELLLHTAYIGLEILMTCYDKVLSAEWHQVARHIIDLGSKGKALYTVQGEVLKNKHFVDFFNRFFIFMMRINCDTAQEYYLQQSIKDKLQGYSFTHPKCTASKLLQLASELQKLKEEFYTGGEYRSRSATMTTERSEFHQNQYHDPRSRVSVTDIALEIISPTPKPNLGSVGKKSSRATLFSRSSSNASQPFKATVLASSMDGGSPQGDRKTSRRISAKEGSSILEKLKKPTIDEQTIGDAVTPDEAPRLTRQPTICYRSPLGSKQSSIEDGQHPPALIETEEAVLTNNTEGVRTIGSDLDPRSHRLQRQDAKSRKTFKRKKASTRSNSMRRHLPRHLHDDTSEGEGGSTDTSPTHRPFSRLEREVLHLQRARSAFSRELSRSHHAGLPHAGLTEQELHHLQHTRSSLGAVVGPDIGARLLQGPEVVRDTVQSTERLPESVEMKPTSSRQRYIQRSKSHDDPHSAVIAPGTARGRIARQGARMVRSRSPSSSPVRAAPGQHLPSPPTSPLAKQEYDGFSNSHTPDTVPQTHSPTRRLARRVKSPVEATQVQDKPRIMGTSKSAPPSREGTQKRGGHQRDPPAIPAYRVNSPPTSPVRQVYIAHYDSSDSMGANESSALLKDDDDSGQSRNSVCIYYDDTIV